MLSQTNFILRSWVIVGLTLLLKLSLASKAFTQEPYVNLVRHIETQELGIASLEGLAFSPAADVFLIVTTTGAVRINLLTPREQPAAAIDVATAIAAPLNMAFDRKGNGLLFLDATVDELVEIKAGANGRPEPDSEAVTRFQVRQFGLHKAQGMTFDPETGALFFLDVPSPQAVPRIVRIIPDPQDRFDGDSAERGGRISNIFLNSLRGSDPRGIAFNPVDSHLYIMSQVEQKLYEVTDQGEVVSC